MKYFRR